MVDPKNIRTKAWWLLLLLLNFFLFDIQGKYPLVCLQVFRSSLMVPSRTFNGHLKILSWPSSQGYGVWSVISILVALFEMDIESYRRCGTCPFNESPEYSTVMVKQIASQNSHLISNSLVRLD